MSAEVNLFSLILNPQRDKKKSFDGRRIIILNWEILNSNCTKIGWTWGLGATVGVEKKILYQHFPPVMKTHKT